MQLNDARIQKLLEDYRGGDQGAFQSLRKEIELYIYHFPRLAYRRNRDICAEFFLFALDRLDSVYRNYPAEAGIRFKTWLNACLKRQFFQFMRYQKKEAMPTVSLDEDLPLAVEPVTDTAPDEPMLTHGMSVLPEKEKLLIRFFYFPDSLVAADIQNAARLFGRSCAELVEIRQGLIEARWKEIGRIRELSEEIGRVNRSLVQMKREAGLEGNLTLNDNRAFELTEKIARLDARRWKLVRALDAPEKEVLKVFAGLFHKGGKAGMELEKARQRLRFELLRLKRQQGEA